jgi:ABC-2 type transport system permease protein
MKSTLKAEFSKVITVRSTYFLVAASFALLFLFAFYIEGFKAAPESLLDPNKLTGEVVGAVSTVTFFAVLVGILLVTHEYRYNTISYTLTNTNRRSKVLLAKIIVVSIFALLFTTVIGVLSPLLTLLGISMNGGELATQQIYYADIIWRALFFGWGYAMLGLIVSIIVRNQIAVITIIFIGFGTVESLIGILLKDNVVYLPFNSLNAVLGNSMSGGEVKVVRSAVVYLAYLVVGWVIAWYLFIKRDAN